MAHCHPVLKERYLALKSDFEQSTGWRLKETCTWRSKEMQQELYKKGRQGIASEKPVTWVDGVHVLSRHNVFPARAVDVAVVVNGVISWSWEHYGSLGPLSGKHQLKWGGSWAAPKTDNPHLELPSDVTDV